MLTWDVEYGVCTPLGAEVKLTGGEEETDAGLGVSAPAGSSVADLYMLLEGLALESPASVMMARKSAL